MGRKIYKQILFKVGEKFTRKSKMNVVINWDGGGLIMLDLTKAEIM